MSLLHALLSIEKEKHRNALATVLHGGKTEEAATHWWVFHAMSDTVHETLFKRIDYEVDLEARTARALIPGVRESADRPIRPPHGGGEHRVHIRIPNGIESELAEIGSATTMTGRGTGCARDGRDARQLLSGLLPGSDGLVVRGRGNESVLDRRTRVIRAGGETVSAWRGDRAGHRGGVASFSVLGAHRLSLPRDSYVN